jgi:pimeloyl-ACP methyl ester carboxylesterase
VKGSFPKPTENLTGIVFLNPGFLPRAGHADSAVHWADSFAKAGYPAFRLDMPGLGDSDGEVPLKLLDFINAGGYASLVSAAIKELVERFNLSGVAIVGLCAGSVSALYTAAATRECRGVVILDPYFFLSYERTKLREEFSRWSSWSRIGALVSDIYDRARYLRLLLRRSKLPRNANLPLLRAWNKLASAGVPILVFKAPGLKAPDLKPRVGEFDYLSYLRSVSHRTARIEIKLVPGANHSFADETGRNAVRYETEGWMRTYFPVIECDQVAAKQVE